MKRPLSTQLITKHGIFDMYVWPGSRGLEPVALATPRLDVAKSVLVRIHSECITADNFGDMHCDCGLQKEKALRMISKSRNGVFVYLRQEAMGLGLYKKVQIMEIMRKGYDMHEAQLKLGYGKDMRKYGVAVAMLKFLGVRNINIITNNPGKIAELERSGFK